MLKPKLYRKRFIPYEMIYLKDDEILLNEDSLIITKWNTLKPRNDISRGISCYFLNKGFKVSKIYNQKDELVYWYCDIIETQKQNDCYIFNDLLVDVILYKNGLVKVVDLDELADALETNLIDDNMLKKALRYLNELLTIIYDNKFDELKKYIEQIEN